MLDSRRCLLMALALAALTVAACGDKPQTPTTPTTPGTSTPPPTPTPPAPPPTPQPACAYAVTAEPDDYDRDGGNGALKIATASGCHWAVTANAGWASVEGPVEGDGPANLKVFVRGNEDASARRITFTVQDQTASISQPGQGDCTYHVNVTVVSLPHDPSSGSIPVDTDRGCRWTAASTVPWLRVMTPAGTGSGAVRYETDSSTGASTRTAVMEVRWLAPTAGQNVRFNQSGSCFVVAAAATGGLPAGSTFSGGVQGGTLTVGADGGKVHLWVLTDPFMGCAWSIESTDQWISWDAPGLHQNRSGDGDSFFTVPANPSPSARTATATIGGWPLTVIQRGR